MVHSVQMTICNLPRIDSTGVLKLGTVFKALLQAAAIILILYVVGLGSFVWLLKKSASMEEDAWAESSRKVFNTSNAKVEADSYEYQNGSEVDRLIAGWLDSNTKCTSGYDGDSSTLEQCELRDKQATKLQSLGICYGEKEQHGYEMKWHKCNSNSLTIDNKVNEELVTNSLESVDSKTPDELETNVTQDKFKPSFDCQKAKSKPELLICNDDELSKLDSELAITHREAKSKALDAAEFKKQTNAAWKWRELNCENKQCLLDWYAERNLALKEILGNTAQLPILNSFETDSDKLLENSDYDAYQQMITKRILMNYRRCNHANIQSRINISLDSDGVANIISINSSGVSACDEIATRAIKEAEPLPVPKNKKILERSFYINFDDVRN